MERTEVTDVLWREDYERGEATGYRNGHRLGRLKTDEGILEFAVPQVPGRVAPWASEIKRALSGRTEELERLVVEMYARGLSMRDIEAAFTGADGRCVLTKSAASQVADRLWEDYLSFAGRDLSGQPIVYLFLDGVAERLHLGQPREPGLAACACHRAAHAPRLRLVRARVGGRALPRGPENSTGAG